MIYVEVFLALSAVAVFLFYKWATFGFEIFQERGIPFKKPWPVFGNAVTLMIGKENLHKLLTRVYLESKTHKVFGFFNFREPVFIVHDRESIKKITIKDFEYFPNRVPVLTDYKDELVNNMIINMKDQRWRDMRNTLTPAFTGSKMRAMFQLINECSVESINYLQRLSSDKQPVDIDLKAHFARYSNDVIASTAFGLKVNSYIDCNNKFYTAGKDTTNFNMVKIVMFFMFKVWPQLMSTLLKIVNPISEQANYFVRIVSDTMKAREEQGIIRPDMIQLLMEAKKESKKSQIWSEEEIFAQCYLFFFAGFDNNSTFVCTTAFELMENPKVQQKLFEEILATHEALNGEDFTYDAMIKMEYLDMVTSECLRKWPLAAFSDRFCAKDYTLTDEHGKEITKFITGDRIWYPISGLHYDEDNFANPHLFDPERFSAANKENIKPLSYLPFGSGPRNCIANRYALMVAKAMIYHLVLSYKIERSEKTAKNLADIGKGFQIIPSRDFWIKLVPR